MPALALKLFFTVALLLADLSPVRAASIAIYAGEFPPFSQKRGDAASGIFVDVVNEITKRLKHPGAIRFLPWKRALIQVEQMQAPQAAMIFPLTRSPEREAKYIWAVPVFSDAAVFLVKKDRKLQVKDLAALRPLRIGVVRASPLNLALEKEHFRNLDVVADVQTNARKLKHGRIDAWYVPEVVGLHTYKSLGFDAGDLEKALSLGTMQLYIAAARSTPAAVVKDWQRVFAEIDRDGTFAKILNQHK